MNYKQVRQLRCRVCGTLVDLQPPYPWITELYNYPQPVCLICQKDEEDDDEEAVV